MPIKTELLCLYQVHLIHKNTYQRSVKLILSIHSKSKLIFYMETLEFFKLSIYNFIALIQKKENEIYTIFSSSEYTCSN